MPRPIWIRLNGKQNTVGFLEMRLEFRSRTLVCTPRKNLDGKHIAFTLFEQLLRGHGYSPIISDSGKTRITLPINDKYGWMVRELAKTYWMAGQPAPEPVDQPITKEVA